MYNEISLHAFTLLAIDNEHIVQRLVKQGTRPALDEITGPADLLSFSTAWIAHCWHESPDDRPSFDGKSLYVVELYDCRSICFILHVGPVKTKPFSHHCDFCKP